MKSLIERYPTLTVFICLQMIDFSTTFMGIHMGAREQNAFVLYIIRAYGLAFALLLLKGLGVLFALHLGEGNKNLRRAVWIYGAAMCWNCAVVSHYAVKFVRG